MNKLTKKDIADIEHNIANLVRQRQIVSRAIFKEREKLYNHRKYLKRKIAKQ